MLYLNPMRRKSASRQGLPVAPGAWPGVGHLPQLLLTPYPLIKRFSRELGPVFWLSAGFERWLLMVCGEEAIEIFKNKTTASSYLRDMEAMRLLFGESLLVLDGKPHRKQRSALNKPFSPSGLSATRVGALAESVIQRRIRSWHPNTPITVLGEAKLITLEILFGIMGVDASDVPEWRKHYNLFGLSALNIPWTQPLSPNWWAERSRRWIDARLQKMIAIARTQQPTDTFLASFVQSRTAEGEMLGERELLDNLRIFVFAGHETTASILAWMMLHLARDPDLWERLVAEATATDTLPLDPRSMAHFPLAEALFRECLRLYPPVVHDARKVIAPTRIHGIDIPVGTITSVPIVAITRDPQRYPEPHRFRPERWLGLDRKPTPVETLPFGAGPHFCLGYHLALLEGVLFAVLCARMLSASGRQLSATGPIPRPIHAPLTHPPRRSRVKLSTSPTS